MGREGDRETVHRARCDRRGAILSDDQDSSVRRALAASDLLIRRRPGEPAAQACDRVEVLDL